MCNCVEQAKERFKEVFTNAESVEFINQELISGKLFSTVGIKTVGKKKKQLLLYSYCPMCGKPYEEAKSNA